MPNPNTNQPNLNIFRGRTPKEKAAIIGATIVTPLAILGLKPAAKAGIDLLGPVSGKTPTEQPVDRGVRIEGGAVGVKGESPYVDTGSLTPAQRNELDQVDNPSG